MKEFLLYIWGQGETPEFALFTPAHFAPILLMLVLFIAVPALNAGTVGIMVPVGVLFTILVARILYKKGII